MEAAGRLLLTRNTASLPGPAVELHSWLRIVSVCVCSMAAGSPAASTAESAAQSYAVSNSRPGGGLQGGAHKYPGPSDPHLLRHRSGLEWAPSRSSGRRPVLPRGVCSIESSRKRGDLEGKAVFWK